MSHNKQSLYFLAISILTLLVSSCVTVTKPVEESYLSVHYIEAPIDWQPNKHNPTVQLNLKVDGKSNTVIFPLSYTIKCKPIRKECKHAIIKTKVTLEASSKTQNEIKVTGMLHAQMGRSLEIQGDALHPSHTKLTVPPSVPVIGEKNFDLPINATLTTNEQATINSLGGSKIILTYKNATNSK